MKDIQNYFHRFLHIKYDDFYIETSNVENYPFYKYSGNFWRDSKHKNLFFVNNFTSVSDKIFNSSVGLDGTLDKKYSVETNSVDLIVIEPTFTDTVKVSNSKYYKTQINKPENWKDNLTSSFQFLYYILKPQSYIIFDIGNFYSNDEILDVIKICIDNRFDCLGEISNYKTFDKSEHIENPNSKIPNDKILIFQRVD